MEDIEMKQFMTPGDWYAKRAGQKQCEKHMQWYYHERESCPKCEEEEHITRQKDFNRFRE